MPAPGGFDITDWIDEIIVLVVVVGSALSGLAKAIAVKLNKSKMEKEAEQSPAPPPPPRAPRPITPTFRPPPARPLASPTAISPRMQRDPEVQVARPLPPPRRVRPPVERTVEIEVPDLVRPLVEMVLEHVGGAEAPQPRPAPPPARQRPQTARRPKPKPQSPRQARLEELSKREEAEYQAVEKRLGHVETHVRTAASEPQDAPSDRVFDPSDRRGLRRAILWNEILGPPLALRSSFNG